MAPATFEHVLCSCIAQFILLSVVLYAKTSSAYEARRSGGHVNSSGTTIMFSPLVPALKTSGLFQQRSEKTSSQYGAHSLLLVDLSCAPTLAISISRVAAANFNYANYL